jgi:hypothetical protein
MHQAFVQRPRLQAPARRTAAHARDQSALDGQPLRVFRQREA